MALKMKDQYKDKDLLNMVRYSVDLLMQQVKIADVTNPAKSKKLLKQINSILDQFDYTVQQVIPQTLIKDYFSGVDEATAVLAEAAGTTAPGLALTKEGLISTPFQKLIHMQALEVLIDDTMMDMNAATRSVRANAAQSIDKTLKSVKTDIAAGLVNGSTKNYTKQAVMKTFREQGMTAFITSDGKNLPLNFYAETVVRTKTRTAQVQGTLNRYQDAGLDLIQIIGNGDSCAKCSAHQGVVMSITGNTPGYPVAGSGGHMLPPFHPNCRCGVNLWDSQFKTDEEKEAAAQRNAAFNPDEDRRTAQQKFYYDQEQRLRRIANAEQKQFMRWTELLQADAPKTLGAFRSMKRQNTLKFQELQSLYRSAAIRKANALRKGLPAAAAVPKVVASDIKELDRLFKRGGEMEKDVFDHLRAMHPEIPLDKIKKLGHYRESWMGDSVFGYSGALQDHYSRKVGFNYKKLSNDSNDQQAGIDADMQKLLDTQSKFFQNKLLDKGYTHIRVYRGMGFNGDKIPDWFPSNYDAKGFTSMNDNEFGRSLASFSYDPYAANGFGQGKDKAAIFEVDVPVKQIWSGFGLGREREIVPLGRVDEVKPITMDKGLKQLIGDPGWAADLKASRFKQWDVLDFDD